MSPACQCAAERHAPRLCVLTGGPGGGKTAVLELVRQHFCEHVVVLPEAASIVFGGGFPRGTSPAARRAAQRAIYHVEVELEALPLEENNAAIVLCDRGTLDGAAYWPEPPEDFWAAFGTTREAELRRYAAVIHMRVPPAGGGYDHRNRLRNESAAEAAYIDDRIAAVWAGHPRRFFVESQKDFLTKAALAMSLIAHELPECCRCRAASTASPMQAPEAAPATP